MPLDSLQASSRLVRELRGPLVQIRRADRRLYVQLRAVTISSALNIAEGEGRQGEDRRHFWRIALGSTGEVRSALRVATELGDLDGASLSSALETLDRLAAMLLRMTR